MKDVDPAFYKNGLRFKCLKCGRCCQSHGEYCYVYLSLPERRRLAQRLGLVTQAFTRRYCAKTDGLYHLRDPGKGCLFLVEGRCGVYGERPSQCRTWPFWPENMNRDVWFGEVAKDCPGVGAGPLIGSAQIEQRLRKAVQEK